MRLCISLRSTEEQRLPLSHLDLLRETLQAYTDVDVSSLSFSDLRVPAYLRAIDRDYEELCIGAGTVQWWLSSPYRQTMHALLDTFPSGNAVTIGEAQFTVCCTTLTQMPEPLMTDNPATEARFSCWTPIVARVYEPMISDKPFFASPVPNDLIFMERIRASLVEKYADMHGDYPTNDKLNIGFDTEYLKRHPRRGTKRIVSEGRAVTGVLAPFHLRGSSDLLRTAWQCGIGDLTNQGFGFVEVLR